MARTLRDFPEAFFPLIVVTGDRRETPPLSRGDVLAYSVSSTDVMHLTALHLVTGEVDAEAEAIHGLLVSDKQFVTDSEDKLRRRFGRYNILVIGSPAVNLLSRSINQGCPFRFSISGDTRRELEEQDDFFEEYVKDEDDVFIYNQCLDGIFDTDAILSRFVGLDPRIETLRTKASRIVPAFKETQICQNISVNPRPIRYLMHKLDQPGIYDSLSAMTRGKSIGPYKDYGLISVMRNPFSTGGDYQVVYVAGVHGPGTAVGLQMLGRKESFADHPFGGVFEVRIDRFAQFYEKLQNSHGRWETPAYKVGQYAMVADPLTSIRVFLSSPGGKDDTQQKSFNQQLRELLEEVCTERSTDLIVRCPYTLPMAKPHHDFWSNILDFEKQCAFVIHDMTDCARGVMVEIGFSFGARRPHFLIWNAAKRPVNEWGEMNIPGLLPTTHIEQIDLTDGNAARRALLDKILDPALSDERPFDCSSCEPLDSRLTGRVAYVYAKEPGLLRFVEKTLRLREVQSVAEEESSHELRICRICQVLAAAGSVIVQLADEDPNGFIVLGMAKAMQKPTFPVTFERFGKRAFAWAQDVVKFKLKTLEQDLDDPLATFLAYVK